MTDTRILLATPHAGYEQRVRGAFGNALNGTLHRWDPSGLPMTFEALAVQLGDPSPDVVVLGPDLDVGLVLDIARRLEQDRPEVHVVLVATPTPQLWQEALRAGVHDIVAPDAPDTELRGVFNRTLQVAARRRRSVSDDDAASTARVITVVSPKGGSGKTTIASNLAVGLAVQAPDRVVRSSTSTCSSATSRARCELIPEHTMADARGPPSISTLALKSLLTPHDSGLWVLCGPGSPADAEDVKPARLQRSSCTLAQRVLLRRRRHSCRARRAHARRDRDLHRSRAAVRDGRPQRQRAAQGGRQPRPLGMTRQRRHCSWSTAPTDGRPASHLKQRVQQALFARSAPGCTTRRSPRSSCSVRPPGAQPRSSTPSGSR
jgi:hypothetical protein